MDTLNNGELMKMVEELISETSCPKCLNTLRSPVHLCTDGHGFCGDCRDELDNCSTCSQPFSSSSSKNILLNCILQVLPKTCKFSGCQVFVRLEDDHEKWCGYQTASCLVSRYCHWTGCAKDILHHIQKRHECTKVLKEENINEFYTSTNLSNYSSAPIVAHGHFFWMNRSKPDDKTMVVDFLHVPNGKIKSSFKISLTFGNSRTSISSSIYVTPENVFSVEDMSMAFVFSKVQRLINSNGFLPVSLTVEKEYISTHGM